MDLVSVIIPAYNRETLLKDAITSVFDQTYRPIECIVVDDGSTDNTAMVVSFLQRLQSKDFVLKYYAQPNAGAPAARNKGTMEAGGDFIQYLDSDDLLYPSKIADQVNFLHRHGACDVVFGDWEKGTTDKKEKMIAYKSDDMLSQMLTERCIAIFAMLMRSNFVKKIGEWDVDILRNQEIDFQLRGVLEGGNFDYLPGLCGLWRTHDEERIANKATFSAAISFYQKWEHILLHTGHWNEDYAKGIFRNYLWFLGENSRSDKKETLQLLREMKRLYPQHSMFQSKRFRIIENIFGENSAIKAWIFRFTQYRGSK